MAKQPAPITDNRAERMLAYMVAATIGISIVAFFAIIIGEAVGASNHGGFSHGIWPVVFVLPLVGLPIGILLIMALLITNMVRRARAAKSATK